jgi:hypothetical protein
VKISEIAAHPGLKRIVRRARRAVKRKAWPEAIDLLNRAVRKRDVKALASTLAHAYEQVDDLSAAIATYDLALKQPGIAPKTQKRIARRQGLLKKALERDTYNAERYGPDSPRYAELIWVHASAINKWIGHEAAKLLSGAFDEHVRSSSGFVTQKWADTSHDIMKHDKIEALLLRWRDGKPWEETGALERLMEMIELHGERSGCRNLDDVRRRYQILEDQFQTVKAEGRLRTRAELGIHHQFRETFGVLMHLGPDGEPYFGGSGFHRLAMAFCLDLWIPCVIGIVHETALEHLVRYRKKPD